MEGSQVCDFCSSLNIFPMSKTIGSVVARLSLGQVLSAPSAISLLLADTSVGDKVVGGEGVRGSGEGVRRGISASSLRESVVAA